MEFIFNNERPIYLQLSEQMKTAMIAGNFAPGEKLPSVRELAAQAKINPNTVQKALGELERQGLIFTERTNGKFVTCKSDAIEKAKEALALSIAKRYLDEMRSIGISQSEALNIIQNL